MAISGEASATICPADRPTVLATKLIILRGIREHDHVEVAAAINPHVFAGPSGEFKGAENVRQLHLRNGVLSEDLRSVCFREGLVAVARHAGVH
jgi:hypothetical protein